MEQIVDLLVKSSAIEKVGLEIHRCETTMSRQTFALFVLATLLLTSCASNRNKSEQITIPYDPSIIRVTDDDLTIAAIRYLSATESTDGQLYQEYRLDFEKALADYLSTHKLKDAFALQVKRDGITFVFPISFLDSDMLPGNKRPGKSIGTDVSLKLPNPDGLDLRHHDSDAQITFILDEEMISRNTDEFSGLPAVILANSVEKLFSVDARGNRIPVLASRVDSDLEGRVWEIQLRSGIRFSDGSELNATLVSDSWHRNFAEDNQTNSELSWLWMDIVGATDYVYGKQQSINGLQVVDKLTLRIVLKAPRPDFPEQLMQSCFGISKLSGESNRLIGTGPFQIQDILNRDGNLTFVFTVNPFYHGEMPRLNQLRFVIQNDRVIDAMMHEQNVGTVVRLKKDIDYFKKLDTVKTVPFPVQPVYFLALNPLSGPLNNLNLRRYIVSAVLRRWEIENIISEAEVMAAPGFSLKEEIPVVSPSRESVPEPGRSLIISYLASDGVARQIAERLHARFDQTGIPSSSPVAMSHKDFQFLRQNVNYDILVDSFTPAFTAESYNLFQLLKYGYKVDATIKKELGRTLVEPSSQKAYAMEKELIEKAVFHPLIRVKYYLVLPAELRGESLYRFQSVDLSSAWMPKK